MENNNIDNSVNNNINNNVDNEKTNNITNTNKPVVSNPETGDRILVFVGLLFISCIGIIVIIVINKKKYNNV